MSPRPAAVSGPHDPYAALRHAPFSAYLIGGWLASVGRQAVTVTAAWEIYQWTHSATALGLVGLVNALPLLALSLPAGALADRFDRRRILLVSQVVIIAMSAVLAFLSLYHARLPAWGPLRWSNGVLRSTARLFEHQAGAGGLRFDEPALPLMYLDLLVMAGARVLAWPARASLVPWLVSLPALSNAIAWNSSAFEVAAMVGPALGGFLIVGIGYAGVYVLDVALGAIYCVLLARIVYFTPPEPAAALRSWRSLLAGAEFVWRRKPILAASTLDLLATLLGGAIALLPIFADDILHVGAIGLGWLRAAPSIGAFGMALWTAHRPPLRHPGQTFLWSVAGFGGAIVVFGQSRWFWLSFGALVLTGIFDNVSVVVRQSLVQLLTPDPLRGRVTGFNQIFIGSSNELGSLRAGLMAAWLGPLVATVFGGACTLAVALGVARVAPGLRRLPALHTLRPD